MVLPASTIMGGDRWARSGIKLKWVLNIAARTRPQLVTDSPSFGGCVAYRCAMPAVTALASGRLDAGKGYGDREVGAPIDSSRWDGEHS